MKINFDKTIRVNTDTEFVSNISKTIVNPLAFNRLSVNEKRDLLPRLLDNVHKKERTSFNGTLALTVQLRLDTDKLGEGTIYSHPTAP